MNQFTKNFINFLVVAVIASILGGAGVFLYQQKFQGPGFTTLSSDQASQKALDFINQNLLKGKTAASLVEVKEQNGLYKMKVKVGEREVESFVTKDGKIFFPEPGIDLTQKPSSQQSQQQQQQEEIPEEKESSVELFVMSFCPFGNKAENTLKPVFELLGDKVNWSFHYIVNNKGGKFSSLHGAKELEQDQRELCVLENKGAKSWFDFVTFVNDNCGKEGGCWKKAAQNIGVSLDQITACVDQKGTQLLSREAKISAEKKATGSPTLLINGVKSKAVYDYGKPNSYKKAICSGFENPPSVCDQQLSAQSSSSAASGGACE